MYFSLNSETKHLFKIASPIIAALLLQTSLGLADNIMVARFNAESLATISIALSVLNPIALIALGVLAGVAPITAKAVSGSDMKMLDGLVDGGIYICIFLSFIIVIILWNIDYILQFREFNPSMDGGVTSYLQHLCWGILPLLCYTHMRYTCEGLQLYTASLIAVAGAIPLNIVLNWLLLYGIWFFPNLGENGVALSTSISWSLMFIVVSIIHRRSSFGIKYQSNIWKNGKQVFAAKRILSLGLPLAVAGFAESGAISLCTLIIANQVVQDLAAHQIALNVDLQMMMVAMGLSFAITIRIASQLGCGRGSVISKSISGSKLAMTICAIVIFIFLGMTSHILPLFYTDVGGIVSLSAALLWCAGLSQVPRSGVFYLLSVFRAYEMASAPMVTFLFVYLLLAPGLTYILVVKTDLGVFSYWAGLGSSHVIAYALLYRKVDNIHIPMS